MINNVFWAIALSSICSVSAMSQHRSFDQFNFVKADSIAGIYPRHSLEDLSLLSKKLTSSLNSDPEKFRAIFKWVCLNITNDYYLYTTNKKKREELSGEQLRAWNKSFGTEVFKQLKSTYSTVCTGYAYLVTELSLRAGLSCETIDGYGRTAVSNIGGRGIPNHSWNAVRLDGQWYLADATWASGAIDQQQRAFVQQYNDTYFLTDPKQFIRNHYPLDVSRTFLETYPTLSEFLNGPLIYVNAIRQQIEPVDPPTFNISLKKGEDKQFIFRSPSKLKDELLLFIDQRRSMNHAVIGESADGYQYSITTSFKQRGTHAVHLVCNDQYLVSYQIYVE